MPGWTSPRTFLAPAPQHSRAWLGIWRFSVCGHSKPEIPPPGWLRPCWAHAMGWGWLDVGHSPPLFWEGLGLHTWTPGLGWQRCYPACCVPCCGGRVSCGKLGLESRNQGSLCPARSLFPSSVPRFLHLSVWPVPS